MTARVVRAAGCLVWRHATKEPQVLLVHRPRYDDWSFPKGKLDPGESLLGAAVREVAEETGLRVRLGPRLPDQGYDLSNGQPKTVAYWTARPPKGSSISTYEPNPEIDNLMWAPLSKARRRLTHLYDRELLDEFTSAGFDSAPLVVLRHAAARRRSTWRHDDGERPLSAQGVRQSRSLVPLLRAYDVRRVISSDAARCVDSVLPYVNATSTRFRLDAALSEEGFDAKATRRLVHRLLDNRHRVVLCSHRPVLPEIFSAAGLDPIALAPGAFVVVHRANGKVVALEQHELG